MSGSRTIAAITDKTSACGTKQYLPACAYIEAIKKRNTHVQKAKGLVSAVIKPDTATPATVALGLSSGSRHNLQTVAMPKPSSSKQPTTTEDVPRSSVNGASAELTLFTERSSECQPAAMYVNLYTIYLYMSERTGFNVKTFSSVPYVGFRNVEYSPSSLTTSPCRATAPQPEVLR